MSNQHEHDREDDRLAALLRSVESGAAPPERAQLAAIREQSLTAFVESAPGTNQPLTILGNTLPSPAEKKPRSRMLTFALRGLAAVAASVAAMAAWLNLGPLAVSGAPFSEVLAGMHKAMTLELRVTKAGRSAEVWIRAAGLVRWDESPGHYRIATGSRLWQIDESTNTATAGDSPWFVNHHQQIDLLGLLEVGVTDSSALLNAVPAGRSQYDGRECLVYRAQLPTSQGPLPIEAYADADTNQLRGILARGAAAGPPLAELQLVAMNPPIDETKFVVSKSLTEDGRIGKVSDAQGVVVLRPMLAGRWTPICRETLLKPGDWLRTEIRGANAVKVHFSSDVELTIGPGTLVECVSPTQAKIHTGETQVYLPKPEKDQPPVQFELLAPRTGGEKLAAPGKAFFRVNREEKLVKLEKVETWPKWLAGFEGTSTSESLGSLIVNLPDGRNEPLTIGYHKVSVEIRDQIARTSIEESFVNHTDARLEGVFHFPLPQDASISGFGMWIGNDLIEADVVEKQRAREIYETILRERRDPGLLEWTSGNLFKARVFPIEAHAEKRVKIVYSQVLPLRANKYRYAYGLRSDLLRTRPLRELSLTVTVNSALPLKGVTCPTHTARTQHTEHSAQVEFAAQEYSPSRDLEVVCEIDGRQSDVVVVPHRRGSDGYLLVQLTPPGVEGNWQREILPDGSPLSLVLLCDTSASMDSEKRRQQAEFVATVLASLGEKDRFLLAAADVATVWASPEPLAPTADNIAKAGDFLANRLSLGWTNLDQAFEAVLQKAPAGAQIVYIGDGIVTAGDRDPASFVKRLAKLFGDKHDGAGCAFHAVTVGNIHEATVLKGIATVGGGSVRAIGGEQTAQTVALELLNEIAQPGLRDLNVEFRGVKVAAVYPDRLPNVAAGTQQILVGRYLPQGQNQAGEIIVTGKRGSESVRYAAKIRFDAAEEGNSFIPRLWARSHLDHLLEQGSSAMIHDEIIALSEEFHIITPYTSLLVLETDADRERFGVKRRYEMRDGERFFQAGKDNANFELAQQQMKRAGDWRLGLRRQILRQLATLGRNPQAFQRQSEVVWNFLNLEETVYQRSSGVNGPMSSTSDLFQRGSGTLTLLNGDLYNSYGGGTLSLGGLNTYTGYTTISGGTVFAGGGGGISLNGGAIDFGPSAGDNLGRDSLAPLLVDVSESGGEWSESLGDLPMGGQRLEYMKRVEPGLVDFDGVNGAWDVGADGDADAEFKFELKEVSALSAEPAQVLKQKGQGTWNYGYFDGVDADEPYGVAGFYPGATPSLSLDVIHEFSFGGRGQGLRRRNRQYEPDYTSWLNTGFPAVAGRPGPLPKPRKKPENWPAEALALANSLLRTDSLQKLAGGIEIRQTLDTFDPVWNRRSSHSSGLTLYGPAAWLTRPLDVNGQTIVQYYNKKERGVFSLALLLGQARTAVPRDLSMLPFELNDGSLSSLHETYRTFDARVEQAGENQARLVLTLKNSTFARHLLIDTARHVLLKSQDSSDGKIETTMTYADFIEVAGTWWATRITTTDAKGRKTVESRFHVQMLAQEAYEIRLQAELAALAQVQFLRQPLSQLKDARQHVADGSANFDERILMVLHFCQLQQWDDVLQQLDEAEKLAAGKPGVRWLRTLLLATIRRNEEARRRLLDEAKQLVAKPQQDELFLAGFLIGQDQSVSAAGEHLPLVELLQPVYERQPADSRAMIQWRDYLLIAYDNAGRSGEALATRRIQAEQSPWAPYRQTEYAQRLLASGRADEAYAWLDKQLADKVERASSDDDALRSGYAELFRAQARWKDLLVFTSQWIARKPEGQTAYSQHLSTLVYNDQLDAANALVEQWLKEGRVDEKLSPPMQARLFVAIDFAHGTAYNIAFYRTDERWGEPLAETARFFATRRKGDISIAQRAMGYRFDQSEAFDRLRAGFLQRLQAGLDELSAEQIAFLVNQSFAGRLEFAEPLEGRRQMQPSEVPVAIWKEIAARLHTRWEKAEDKDGVNEKHALGESLRTIYANRFADTDLLPFLRERIKAARPEFKTACAASLFDVLLARPWTDKLEKEAFQLLPELSSAEEPALRLTVQAPALYRLVDAMLAGRQAAAVQERNDQGQVNPLTRVELAKRSVEFRKAALTGLAERLADEAAALEKQKSPLADWVTIELLWLDAQLEKDLDQVAAFCWRKLGDAPPQRAVEPDDADLLPEKRIEEVFEALLRQRTLTTVMNLAARTNAKPAAIDKLLKYIDTGAAAGDDAATAWRNAKYQILVALDRPADLERELRAWIRTDVTTARWRKTLAQLLAEQGSLDEAIQLFEAAEKDKLLTASDYRTLSDWYLVRNRREAYERARIESFKQLSEGQLNRITWATRNRWYQTNVPLTTELDENTLFAYRALFEKSANPENYVYQLRDLYAACRDFRLLEMLPEATLGRSPQQIYPFLQQVTGNILSELRSEASADEIVAQIKRVRERKLTPTDLRALDLFEAVVERRSAQVQNQPGPHVEACLAALRRAFDRTWADGEPRLMAGVLSSLGALEDPRLVDEQLRELRELQKAAPADSRDRLHITNELCKLLFWNYNRKPEALQTLEAEITSYEQAQHGKLPHEDNQILDHYVSMLSDSGQFAAGEIVWKQHLERPENDDQRKYFSDRMWNLYNQALEHKGEVSLGSGETLLQNLIAYGLRQVDAAVDENTRYQAVNRLVETFEVAQRQQIRGASELLRTFALERTPTILERQTAQYPNTAIRPTSVIRELLGAKAALRYVVERMEQWPQRLQVTWNNSWNQFGQNLGRYRQEAAEENLNIQDLEPRVLALVVAELKREMRSGETNNSGYLFRRHHNHFWEAKANDFAAAANEVYQEKKGSGRRVVYIADYLWHGLELHSRAIELLLVAHKDGVLDQPGQVKLIEFLHEEKRYAESIPLLEPLVQTQPDAIAYRALLMKAYFHSQRPQQLAELVRQTDEHFHQQGRWTEDNISELAKACFVCALHEKAVGYFDEAIALHRRNRDNRIVDDAALSDWYQELARAHSALGHTKEAVEAASGAIVCWSPRHDQRQKAIDAVRDVLRGAKDLDGYVKHLDEESARSGQDSPLLRKSLGAVYQERKEFAKAIAQFQLARELQPNDKEVCQALIVSYDALNRPDEATKQLIAQLDFDRHDLKLYEQLAGRLKNDGPEAERAATSIIEAGPNEAENHQALAELRQQQDRWNEASSQWSEVAELRSLEPTGLLGLAAAQLHQKQWDAARKTLDKLQKTEWPSRFQNELNKIPQLRQQLPK